VVLLSLLNGSAIHLIDLVGVSMALAGISAKFVIKEN